MLPLASDTHPADEPRGRAHERHRTRPPVEQPAVALAPRRARRKRLPGGHPGCYRRRRATPARGGRGNRPAGFQRIAPGRPTGQRWSPRAFGRSCRSARRGARPDCRRRTTAGRRPPADRSDDQPERRTHAARRGAAPAAGDDLLPRCRRRGTRRPHRVGRQNVCAPFSHAIIRPKATTIPPTMPTMIISISSPKSMPRTPPTAR
jgi:hypothetical protein